MSDEMMTRVRGDRFDFMTSDPVMIVVVRRCAELAEENEQLRHHEVARYRTLRRDVSQIKRALTRPPNPVSVGSPSTTGWSGKKNAG